MSVPGPRQSELIARVSIALNNIGVEMLERRCYEQAFVTLSDAMRAVRTTFCRGDFGVDYMALLEEANRRASRPSPIDRRRTLRVVNLTDHQDDIMRDYDSNETIVYSIRIEDAGSRLTSPGSSNDREIQAAIILHNAALSNLCLSHVEPQKFENRQAARQMFEFAGSIIERATKAKGVDEFNLRQLATVNIAILQGLMSLSRDEKLRYQVERLRSAINFIDGMLQDIVSYDSPAPAA